MTVLRSALERVRNSVAYRMAGPCQSALALIPPAKVPARGALDLTYLTLTGGAHLPMLRESVASLAHAWRDLPRLRIVGDGSVTREQVRASLGFWPGEPEFFDWRELIPAVRARRYESVLRFAERVPMARKMVAVIGTALESRMLYSDTDVLWFRQPVDVTGGAGAADPGIAMSPDAWQSYDSAWVPSRLVHLSQRPFFCAGIMYLNGDVLAACRLDELCSYAAEHGVERTEQTIFAEANHQLGGKVFPDSEFALFDGDRFSLAPSYFRQPWVARHYIGPVRHLFWRDALALRFWPVRN